MRLLVLSLLMILSPVLMAEDAISKKLTVGELKSYIHARFDVKKLEALSQEEAIRCFTFMAGLDGMITGVKMADELLEPERPLLKRLSMEDSNAVYRDFLAYLDKRKNIKDDANGYNQFVFFLLTNYTDHPTTLKMLPFLKEDLEAMTGKDEPPKP